MAGETVEQEVRLEAERVHESAQHSSETQFEYAKRWRRADRVLSGCGALLAATSGVGALSDLFGLTTAAVFALMAAATTAVASALGAQQISERAAKSANSYRNLQQDARVFLNIELPSASGEQAKHGLRALIQRLQKLNNQAEIPSDRAWKRAKSNLAEGAQTYRVD